jgi:putative membrane protein
MSTLFAFLHHLCAFTLVSAVAIEFTVIRQELTLSSARRLQVTDTVLCIAAGALFVVGLLRVFYFEKDADYYFHSHAFTAKLSIFIAIGLLSIVPTVEFLSWRSAVSAGQPSTGGTARSIFPTRKIVRRRKGLAVLEPQRSRAASGDLPVLRPGRAGPGDERR